MTTQTASSRTAQIGARRVPRARPPATASSAGPATQQATISTPAPSANRFVERDALGGSWSLTTREPLGA